MGIFRLFIFLVLSFFSSIVFALSVASWNVLHLGWDDDIKDYGSLVEVISDHDFVALQEVMDIGSIGRLVDGLNVGHSKKRWGSLVSHRSVGRGSYREFYAFLYRLDRIKYAGGSNLYLDPGDKFSREPYSARFCEIGGHCFVAATVHLIYGKTVSRREVEAGALAGYVDYLRAQIARGLPILLMGDFNLPYDSRGFTEIRQRGFVPLFKAKTTLSRTNYKYVSSYDNIWIDTQCSSKAAAVGTVSGTGVHTGARAMCDLPNRQYVDRFPRRLGVSHILSRHRISDHAPVVAAW